MQCDDQGELDFHYMDGCQGASKSIEFRLNCSVVDTAFYRGAGITEVGRYDS